MDWKFFIVEITYRVPAEELGETVAEHRAHLKTGYDQGWLLVSGPLVPRTGGRLIARAPSRESLDEFISRDPYRIKGLADYHVFEFNPVLFAPSIESWVKE